MTTMRSTLMIEREKRDVQFEMSLFEVQCQKERREKLASMKEFFTGVHRFESNLVRLGITETSSGDVVEKIASDDAVMFNLRIKEDFDKQQLAIASEVARYKEELKQRITRTKLARRMKRK